MSGKNQFPNHYQWQATDPSLTFQPNPYQSGSLPSGVNGGVMTLTNSIWSQIVDVSKMDNIGLEVSWTGNANGTFSVLGSNSGTGFFALDFSPALAQPSGIAGGYGININQFPWKYILLSYVNASGNGVLTVLGQQKDLN